MQSGSARAPSHLLGIFMPHMRRDIPTRPVDGPIL
jgi:hypothetical protein